MARKILVVDDEPDILKSVAFILKKSGYEVFTAEDGEKAISMVKEHMPDLILLDLRMPGKDGFEVCCELKSDNRFQHIPIILLTASAGIRQKEFERCKHDSFVLKPFRYDDLLGKIKELIPQGPP